MDLVLDEGYDLWNSPISWGHFGRIHRWPARWKPIRIDVSITWTFAIRSWSTRSLHSSGASGVSASMTTGAACSPEPQLKHQSCRLHNSATIFGILGVCRPVQLQKSINYSDVWLVIRVTLVTPPFQWNQALPDPESPYWDGSPFSKITSTWSSHMQPPWEQSFPEVNHGKACGWTYPPILGK